MEVETTVQTEDYKKFFKDLHPIVTQVARNELDKAIVTYMDTNPSIKEIINASFQNESVLSIGEDLSIVGKVFNLAFNTSRGTVLAPKFAEIEILLLRLMGEFKKTCNEFVSSSITCVKWSELAITTNNIDICNAMFTQIKATTEDLMVKATEIIIETDHLYGKTTDVNKDAHNEEARTNAERQKLQADLEDSRKRDEELKKQINQLETQYQEAYRMEREIDREYNENLFKRIIRWIFGIKKRKKDMSYHNERVRLEQLLSEQRRVLYENIRKIQEMNSQNFDLEKALVALKLIVDCLGKLLVIISNLRLYWVEMNLQLQFVLNCIEDAKLLLGGTTPEDNDVRELLFYNFNAWLGVIYHCSNASQSCSIAISEYEGYLENPPKDIPAYIQATTQELQLLLKKD